MDSAFDQLDEMRIDSYFFYLFSRLTFFLGIIQMYWGLNELVEQKLNVMLDGEK
jgi:hypothetical protein